jgi:tRNA threonylcarbamoyladenosine biosynthesis protein TsaB
MLSLCISTSTDAVSVAIGEEINVAASFTLRGGKRHAEALIPTIEQLLDAAGKSVNDLGLIGIDIGPGLFTGMRVGIATASAMAQALDIDVAEVCSLDALAQSVMSIAQRDDVVVWSTLDARRGEIFYACYRIGDRAGEPVLERVVNPVVGTAGELAEAMAARGQRSICLGSGATRYATELRSVSVVEWMDGLPDVPDAAAMVPMVHTVAIRDACVKYGNITPMYLRPPDAEINWETR